MDSVLDSSCVFCFQPRDASSASSKSFDAAHRKIATASFGRSAGKAGISNAQPSLSQKSKHVHGPSEHKLFLKNPFDETENPKKTGQEYHHRG